MYKQLTMGMFNPFALGSSYKITHTNNRKETRGRATRKQYVPLYSAKDIEKMYEAKELPTYEIERRARQKRLALHER